MMEWAKVLGAIASVVAILAFLRSIDGELAENGDKIDRNCDVITAGSETSAETLRLAALDAEEADPKLAEVLRGQAKAFEAGSC